LNRRNALKLLGATAGFGLTTPALARDANQGVGQERRKFVLIHGAWHNASAWDGVAQLLRLSGHLVETPTLPGMNPGESRVGIQFSDYVDALVEPLRYEKRRIVLVGHSSAGMLIQAAAPRIAGVLDMVVFSNAFVVGDGQSQLDNIPPDAAAGLTALSQTTDDGTVPVEPLEGFFRGALMEGDSTAAQDALLSILQPQPFSLLSGVVDTKPFDKLSVDKGVLFCVRDHSADYPGMAARLRDYRVVTAEGSHEMLFANPARYTKALLKLVSNDRC